MNHAIFVSCPRNMEYLLEDELKQRGLIVSQVSPMGVSGDANLKTIYEICMWSRLANRVQLILFSGLVNNQAECLQLCTQYPWQDIFTVDKTIAIEFHGESSFINNTMYGAQLVKDGIVDYFRPFGHRPNVDKKHPDIRLHAHLKHQKLTVSLDLVGYSLHQRGYRAIAGSAPLKENIAAAMLIRAQWPKLAKQGYSLVDPMCGSGTLLIEAAMMASNTAPGLFRSDQAFNNWQGHQAALWQEVVDAAQLKRQPISNDIIGFDSDRKVVTIAQENIDAVEMTDAIKIRQQPIQDYQQQPGPGLMVCNPPYGERLEDPKTLFPLYQNIGKALYNYCQGWQAAILTANPQLAQAIGLRHIKQYNLYNGPIKVKVYCYDITPSNQLKIHTTDHLNVHTQALYNRLMKNKKHLSKWLKRTHHSCYRLYDADLPDYSFAIDVYKDWAHVQEYAPPKEIPEQKAQKRIAEIIQLLPAILNIPADHIILKQRKRQKGKQQYQPLASSKKSFIVTEGAAQLKINLHDYLDTGLFLDHRPLRLEFGQDFKGKKLLNCFCYTAAFSVHAALGGATTYNVDLSRTYLDWAKDNFRLNYLSLNQHQFVQADCLQWLKNCQDTFDVILLDPPSFSNSKRMDTTLDIQRDQKMLIDLAMKLLNPDGILYFSNNYTKFKLANELSEAYKIENITRRTLDEDFKNSKNIHQCYKIQQRDTQ